MEGCMCEKNQASLYRTRNSEVWRRFLDGLGMHGLEWSGNIVEMEGCMDAEQYVSILEDKLLPSMANSELSKRNIIFQ